MAKYDLRHAAAVTLSSATASPTLTFAGSPTAGDLIVLAFGTLNANITTAPTGFTSILSYVIGGGSRLDFYAKVASGSEGSSFSITYDTSRDCGGIGYIIEGSFASTAAITMSSRETDTDASVNVLNAAVSLDQAGRAIAWLHMEYNATLPASVSSWSNSFTGVGAGGGPSSWLHAASRSYATADSGVQTTATLSTSAFTNEWMMRITEAAGGGSTSTPAFGRFGVRGPVR